MSVYVDELRDWGWYLGQSCHLTADTDDELHEFARRIGLRREWAQRMDDPRQEMRHYDLTAGRRADAVRHGAVEVDARERLRACAAARGAS